jgi:hypothetical protein
MRLPRAQRLSALAQLPDPNDRTIGEGVIDISQHYLGDQPRARLHIDCALVDCVVTADDRSHPIRFQIDQLVMTRVFLARILWLRGIELLMAEAMGQTGQIAEGLAAIDDAIEHSERTQEVWLMAELLRVRGELLLSQQAAEAAAAAEQHFRQSLDLARRQGALFWELRAAMSLAKLLHGEGRFADAEALLRPVYDRSTEGFDTADLIAAKRLLGELGSAEHE